MRQDSKQDEFQQELCCVVFETCASPVASKALELPVNARKVDGGAKSHTFSSSGLRNADDCLVKYASGEGNVDIREVEEPGCGETR